MISAMGLVREGGCRVMRIRHVDDVLHERPAVARMPVPVVGEQVASFETLLQVVLVEHGEAMPHAVYALKADPSLAFIRRERFAERVCIVGGDRVELSEPRLDHTMVAA